MTDKNLTEIICIVDRSGSMQSVRDDAIGGFNQFLEDQKKLSNKAIMTYTQFNDTYEIVHNGKPIQDISSLTNLTYIPEGCTALLDAIGRTLNEVGVRLDKTPEPQRPGKVIVVILTDGMENASREFKRDQIKTMIEEQTNKYNWQFVYLAANQDAFAEGGSLGIHLCASYDSANTKGVYQRISCAVSQYRDTGGVNLINDKDS